MDREQLISEFAHLLWVAFPTGDDFKTKAKILLEFLDQLGYYNMHFYGVATPDPRGEHENPTQS